MRFINRSCGKHLLWATQARNLIYSQSIANLFDSCLVQALRFVILMLICPFSVQMQVVII